MDIVSRISCDLENEGVYLSNEKILKIMSALKSLCRVYYRVYQKKCNETPEGDSASVITDLNERLVYQMTLRTSLKEGIVQALASSLETVLKA